MERHVDTRQRNRAEVGKSQPRAHVQGHTCHSRETTLENDETSLGLQLLGSLEALVDNLAELFLDLIDRHDLGQLGQINLLNLDQVEYVAEGGK